MVVLLTCLSFLFGSFPSGIVLGRLVTGGDVRKTGSGNFGAANVARTAGLKVGIAVAALDILKGVLPVLLARHVGLDHVGLAVVACAAVLGHDFSIFVKLKGGKGVATTLGVLLALAPLPTLLVMVVWLLVIAVSSYSSLASLVALAVLPVIMGVFGGPPAFVVAATLLFLLAAGKHWENIVRLAQGRETGFKRRRSEGHPEGHPEGTRAGS